MLEAFNSNDVHLESLFLPLGAAVCVGGSECVVQTFVLLLSAFAFALASFCYLLCIEIRSLGVCWMPIYSRGMHLESLFLPLGAAECEDCSVCVVQTFVL